MKYICISILSILFLSCNKTTSKSDGFTVNIHYIYNGKDSCETIKFNSSGSNIDSIGFAIFMQKIAQYDYNYFGILYAPIEKKLQIPYPFKYQIINQMGDKVKQDTLLEAKAIQRRIEKDYWGRMWFKAQGLKEPEKKHKNKKQHKKERKKPHIEKIPQFNFKPRIIPTPPSF